MNNLLQVLIFLIDDQQYALSLSSVIRTIRAVEVTPLPLAPASIYGIVDYQGQIIPVMNIRHRLLLKKKELSVDDRFIIASTSHRTVAMVVDHIGDILTLEEAMVTRPTKIDPDPEIAGLIRREDGIIFIYDLDQFLSEKEEEELARALASKLSENIDND